DNNTDSVDKEITIEYGMTVDDILSALKSNNLIRNELFTKLYIKLENLNLQAGIYEFNSNMSSIKIINMISNGDVTDKYQINLTFKEGENIVDYASVIAENTNNTEEDVYSLLDDSEYIDSLISEYWFLTDEIKDGDIYYPLEGYLFPETYRFNDVDVTIEEIFNTMLNQTNIILTKYKSEIESSDYTVHELLTLASIVELEGLYDDDRAMLAGVFYNRLNSGWSLGSDVTTYYAVQKDMGEYPILSAADIAYDSPYNTRLSSMAGKLPIGPIANPGEVSIKAVIEPTDSDYYYFIANCTTGETIFSKTNAEHVAAVAEVKALGCEF
ncbi:MAG TPA: endolytic transglycosylase MltG, partial [Bacilli bacterium]|nr:endolytic transglycosylase MltG [Bacilli bacterium]